MTNGASALDVIDPLGALAQMQDAVQADLDLVAWLRAREGLITVGTDIDRQLLSVFDWHRLLTSGLPSVGKDDGQTGVLSV